jgi:Mlc titration factor MtfA (ptsG expression regulator)
MRPLGRAGRRRQAAAEPFPEGWRDIVARRMVHWHLLDAAERSRLEDLVKVFAVDKRWQAARGFEITEEVRVTIAGMACLLVLGLDYDHLRRIDWIVVHPRAVVVREPTGTGVDNVVSDAHVISGQAEGAEGSLLLTWDAVAFEGRHPERGDNVVHHEVAHKLDMLTGAIDGTPPIADAAMAQRWHDLCTATYQAVRSGRDDGVLRPYAGVNPAEFFAVLTETFFNRPIELRAIHTELYALLVAWYRQDPAARLERFYSRSADPER